MALGSKGGPNTSKLLSHCAPPRMTAWFGSTWRIDRKSTRLNSSHLVISYAVFCFKKNRAELVGRASGGSLSHLRRPRPHRRVVSRVHKGGLVFFFNDTATTEIYTLSLHDALPI